MTGSYFERSQDVAQFKFSKDQASRLHDACRHVAAIGGPDAFGAAALSEHHAKQMKKFLNAEQSDLLRAFTSGQICAIEFSAMLPPPADPLPDVWPFACAQRSMRPAVAKLNGIEVLALSSRSYRFSRSECFLKDDAPPPDPSSILQFDKQEGFTLRYSTYRFSLDVDASPPAQCALNSLERAIKEVEPKAFVLGPRSALLINNNQALHSRDIVRDNRRLLIRLFAYAPHTEPLVLQPDPLIVRG
jgi:hypothetical protein